MLTLISYPGLFGLADNNPYGLKVFAVLKLGGLGFRQEHVVDASAAPRGQLPYLRRANAHRRQRRHHGASRGLAGAALFGVGDEGETQRNGPLPRGKGAARYRRIVRETDRERQSRRQTPSPFRWFERQRALLPFWWCIEYLSADRG